MDIGDLSFDLDRAAQERAPDPSTVYDLLILGGGPAAMSALIYAARKMIKLALLTEDIGGQVAWTSEIENYIGFQTVTGMELTEKFKEHVQQFDVPLLIGQKVVTVRRRGELFEAVLEDGSMYAGRTVIYATGKRDRPLNVPGEKELVGHGVAYCATCDAPFFKKKKVVVVGGGNSAFTAALDLLKLSAAVTMVNLAPGWQADQILIDAVTKYGDQVKFLNEHQIQRIVGEQRVEAVRIKNHKTGAEHEMPIDGVFVEIGLLPNSDPVKDLVELNQQGEVVIDCHCRTSVPGFFGAGDVTTVPYKQIVISAGEGSKAALKAYDYLTGKGWL